jgi:hypothetical protein
MKNVKKKFINAKWNFENIYNTANKSVSPVLAGVIWDSIYTCVALEGGTNSYIEDEIKAVFVKPTSTRIR